MCCCGRSTINGQSGAYSWDGKTFSTYHPNPPALQDGDVLLYDEPGRCGGIDSHSHHFRLVNHYGMRYLLVRHGGGDERIYIGGSRPGLASFDKMDSDERYWMLQLIYETQRHNSDDARMNERGKWVRAAIEKRIKVNRRGKRHTARIESETITA